MKKLFFSLVCLSPFCGFAQQDDDHWQPDSIYANRKVKTVLIYQTTPQDITEIIHLNNIGKKIKVDSYSPSYDKKTRKLKRLELVALYKYDCSDKLIKIIDSTINYGNEYSLTRRIFEYDSTGKLRVERYFVREENECYREIRYFHSPFRSNLITRNDTIVTLNEMIEYDKDFYPSRQTGFYFQPKMEYQTISDESGTTKIQRSFLEKRETDLKYNNIFDKKGKIVSSDLKNNGHNVYKLKYKYYSNGLLKSVVGEVPTYFKYEYFE
jgi:hypothetical protein